MVELDSVNDRGVRVQAQKKKQKKKNQKEKEVGIINKTIFRYIIQGRAGSIFFEKLKRGFG